jgi:hypothetical protein
MKYDPLLEPLLKRGWTVGNHKFVLFFFERKNTTTKVTAHLSGGGMRGCQYVKNRSQLIEEVWLFLGGEIFLFCF